MPDDAENLMRNCRVDADVSRIGESGTRLEMSSDGPMFVTSSPDWHRACFDAFYTDADELRQVGIVDSGGGTFNSLVRAHRRGGEWLEICGSRQLFEPCEIVYGSADELAAHLRRLFLVGDPIELTRVSTDTLVIDEFQRAARRRGFTFQIAAPQSAFLSLSGGASCIADLVPSAKRRTDLQRTAKRLAEAGRVDYEWLRPGEMEVDAVINRAAAVEDSGWKRHQSSSMRRRPEVAKFVFQVARLFAARRHFIVAFLNVDGAAIAMQMILEFNGAWHELKIGYDEQWRHVSPGMQLTLATLLRASQENIRRYEFMGNEEPRHATFGCHKHGFTTLIYLPIGLRGIRAMAEMIRYGVVRRVRLLKPGKVLRSHSREAWEC